MGGKNAILVMEDADLDLAVDGILWSAFGTTGQRCTACSRLIVQEGVMALSKEERCRELARLVGIPLIEGEVAEVAERFESLMRELERLTQLDLVHIQPVLVFPEEEV